MYRESLEIASIVNALMAFLSGTVNSMTISVPLSDLTIPPVSWCDSSGSADLELTKMIPVGSIEDALTVSENTRVISLVAKLKLNANSSGLVVSGVNSSTWRAAVERASLSAMSLMVFASSEMKVVARDDAKLVNCFTAFNSSVVRFTCISFPASSADVLLARVKFSSESMGLFSRVICEITRVETSTFSENVSTKDPMFRSKLNLDRKGGTKSASLLAAGRAGNNIGTTGLPAMSTTAVSVMLMYVVLV